MHRESNPSHPERTAIDFGSHLVVVSIVYVCWNLLEMLIDVTSRGLQMTCIKHPIPSALPVR